jgi:hypothetical protein
MGVPQHSAAVARWQRSALAPCLARVDIRSSDSTARARLIATILQGSRSFLTLAAHHHRSPPSVPLFASC